MTDLETILEMKTLEEADIWLSRHGYGPGLSKPLLDEWKKKNKVKEPTVEKVDEEKVAYLARHGYGPGNIAAELAKEDTTEEKKEEEPVKKVVNTTIEPTKGKIWGTKTK